MPKFYTTQETADMLLVTEKVVRKYISRGLLKAISLNGNTGRGRRELRIPEESLREFVNSRKVVS